MPQFDVTVRMDTDGDDSVVGVISVLAGELPRHLAASVGMDFRPWSYVGLTLRIEAATARDALDEVTTRVDAAFELFGPEPPAMTTVQIIELPEPVALDRNT